MNSRMVFIRHQRLPGNVCPIIALTQLFVSQINLNFPKDDPNNLLCGTHNNFQALTITFVSWCFGRKKYKNTLALNFKNFRTLNFFNFFLLPVKSSRLNVTPIYFKILIDNFSSLIWEA